MKNFFLLICLSFCLSAIAQDPSSSFYGDTLTFTQRNDAAFAPLNKSRIPHGILNNRVFQFAHLDEMAQDDTFTVMHWIQGVSELERACISWL